VAIVSFSAVAISYTANFSVDRDEAKLIVKYAKRKFKTYKPSWYTDLSNPFIWQKRTVVTFPLLFRHNTLGSFLLFLKETKQSTLMDLADGIRSQIPFAIQ
jgi:hypothetical protein